MYVYIYIYICICIYMYVCVYTKCRETGPICANPVYDSWYALWVPVIQPALGILMASVILVICI